MLKKQSSDSLLKIAQERLIASIDRAITSHTITVGGKKIHYIEIGKGKPIVLLHGATLGWGQWYKNIEVLSKKHRVIAFDLPGAGMSSRVRFRGEHLEGLFVESIASAIDKIGVKKYDVIGHSFGGWVAGKLALKYPKRVRKLVMINPVGLTRDVPKPLHLLSYSQLLPRLLNAIILGRSSTKTKNFLHSVVVYTKLRLSEPFVDHFHAARLISKSDSPFHLMAAALDKGKLKKDYHILPDIRSISRDTLIVWGKKDTSMYFPHELLKIRNPRVTLHIYKDSGHIPFIEKAEHFNQLLQSFLQG